MVSSPNQSPYNPLDYRTSLINNPRVAQILILFKPDPGFCNTNLRMVHVNIDMAHPANQADTLRPELEENEFIEVFTVPLAKFLDECKRLEKEGYAIDARVGTLAEGMELAKRFTGRLSGCVPPARRV
jgi:ADP-ribose pyrophosphatase